MPSPSAAIPPRGIPAAARPLSIECVNRQCGATWLSFNLAGFTQKRRVPNPEQTYDLCFHLQVMRDNAFYVHPAGGKRGRSPLFFHCRPSLVCCFRRRAAAATRQVSPDFPRLRGSDLSCERVLEVRGAERNQGIAGDVLPA